MSKMKSKLMDFLDEGGRDLHYDEYSYPEYYEMDGVLEHSIPAWEYFGKTKDEFYGGKDE